MPSWNIHTAHVERLVESRDPEALGIEDVNAFLFGCYVPDIYVGFMVPDATFRVDYCMTHLAMPNLVPVPNADFFWNRYVVSRLPSTPEGRSLALGAWAHLLTDRYYNGNFRTFWLTHDVPTGEILRKGKQGDFDLFGHSLHISSHVEATEELIEAAKKFWPYSVLSADVEKAIAVADAIVVDSESMPDNPTYQLLDAEWMTGVFNACDERTAIWLETWKHLQMQGRDCFAADVRTFAGLPAATPDDINWQNAKEGSRNDSSSAKPMATFTDPNWDSLDPHR